MDNYLAFMETVKDFGEKRKTRSGETISLFGESLRFDLRKGFPAVTTKKLMFKAVMGELLWFLNGETTLPELRHRSNLLEGAWTIWDNDCKRWHNARKEHPLWISGIYDYEKHHNLEDLGNLYGYQWRNFNGEVDQIHNLVEGLKEAPTSRYHLVTAWNPVTVRNGSAALPPCHTHFQCYVTEDGYLDLQWYQRSVDIFLGLPFNIASYAALMHILCSLTGLKPRFLTGSFGDAHIYTGHLEAVKTQLQLTPKKAPQFVIPKIECLEDLKTLTAKDFSLEGYEPHPAIKAPLLVGG